MTPLKPNGTNPTSYPTLNAGSPQARASIQNEVGTIPDPFPQPFPPMESPGLDQLRREYVAGGGWAWYGQVARTLPNAIDDVTADFGDDLYERMLFDPQVSAVSTIFKASILETGLTLTSAVKSKTHVDFDLAAEIANEAESMINEFDGSLSDVLWNLLDCVVFGNKVAEQTYRVDGAQKDGRKILVLDKLKVRPRRSTVFAVDIYLNLVGLLIRVPPNATPWAGTMMFGPENEPFNLVPPHKFVITNFRTKDGDPRGTSILRAAYSPWWRKQQIIPEYLKYISQFAGPSLIGYVAPNATPQPDPNNPSAPPVTAEQVMLAAMLSMKSGTAIALPNGAQVDPLLMQGDGAAFLRAIDHCDQQITKAVLTQELATEEGKHMARAAAQVHQDILDTLVRQSKFAFAEQLRRQLFKNWVSYNWGDKARHLAPMIGLGEAILREQSTLWTACSQMAGQGYLAPSQLRKLDELVGLPIRDESEAVIWGQYGWPDPEPDQKAGLPPVTAAGAAAAAAPPPSPKEDGQPLTTKPEAGPQQKPTVVRPSITDRVGVRAHHRAYPATPEVQKRSGVAGTRRAHLMDISLPMPDSGAFG